MRIKQPASALKK